MCARFGDRIDDSPPPRRLNGTGRSGCRAVALFVPARDSVSVTKAKGGPSLATIPTGVYLARTHGLGWSPRLICSCRSTQQAWLWRLQKCEIVESRGQTAQTNPKKQLSGAVEGGQNRSPGGGVGLFEPCNRPPHSRESSLRSCRSIASRRPKQTSAAQPQPPEYPVSMLSPLHTNRCAERETDRDTVNRATVHHTQPRHSAQ